jgi:hypothetical protein
MARHRLLGLGLQRGLGLVEEVRAHQQQGYRDAEEHHRQDLGLQAEDEGARAQDVAPGDAARAGGA